VTEQAKQTKSSSPKRSFIVKTP